MTAPADFPDWTNPVAFVESTDVLTPPAAQLVANVTSVDIATAGFVSLDIEVALPISVSVQRYLLAIQWFEPGVFVGADTFSFHSGFAYNGNFGSIIIQVPVRATSAILVLSGSDNAAMSVFALGSNREIARPVITTNNSSAGKLLLSTGSVNVAASSSQTFYVPPVARAISLRLAGSNALTITSVNGVAFPGGSAAAPGLDTLVGTTTTIAVNDFVIPCVGLEVVLQNTDGAGAHPMAAVVWDVS